MAYDAVKIGDTWRICHGGTQDIVMLDETHPLDMFTCVIDEDAIKQNKVEWKLMRRAASRPPGFATKGATLRTIEMVQQAKIVVLAP